MLGSTLTTELPRLVRGAGMDTSESDNGVTGRAGTATCLSALVSWCLERGRPGPRRPLSLSLPPTSARGMSGTGLFLMLGALLAGGCTGPLASLLVYLHLGGGRRGSTNPCSSRLTSSLLGAPRLLSSRLSRFGIKLPDEFSSACLVLCSFILPFSIAGAFTSVASRNRCRLFG